jgi:hypothetical protein
VVVITAAKKQAIRRAFRCSLTIDAPRRSNG